MTLRSLLLAASVAAIAVSSQSAFAEGAKIGTLTCDVEGGAGLVLGSQRALACVFTGENGAVEKYTGSITKFGLDLGVLQNAKIGWTVIAPTGMPAGALAGAFAGATAEVTLGVGIGGNVLVGGNGQTISLQPISLSTQTGLNVAGGVAGLTLTYVPPAKHHRHHRHH